MSDHRLPLLGGPNVVDLSARATNKRLREIAAEGMAKNKALLAQVNLLGDTLHEAVELLKAARDILSRPDSIVVPDCEALAARITERVGD